MYPDRSHAPYEDSVGIRKPRAHKSTVRRCVTFAPLRSIEEFSFFVSLAGGSFGQDILFA